MASTALRRILPLAVPAMLGVAIWPLATAAQPAPAAGASAASATIDLPTIDVTALTPLSSTGIDPDKLPISQTLITREDITRTQSSNIVRALNEQVPSVTLDAPSGNDLLPDLMFRGFEASPVSGTPQGLAVYQNGVRINEAFGDTVNWDLIPTVAIRSLEVVTNDPAYGLNALGGALTIQMKDGFTFQGYEATLQGGSFGRVEGSFQAGRQFGNWATYLAIEGIHDDGFRRYSNSDIRRLYGDIGYKAEGGEYHLNLGLADNLIGATGSVPVELLAQDYSAVYTTPQTIGNHLGFVNLTGALPLTSTWSLQGNAYVRFFHQRYTDGNTTDVQACDDPNGGLLCFGDGTTPANGLNGTQLANTFNPAASLGEIDRTSIRSRSEGGSVQATNTDAILGHPNHFLVGASIDVGDTDFTANTELGTINQNYQLIGSGVFLGDSGSPVTIGPVNLHTTNIYGGLYAVDTFDVTQKLAVTGGGRLNIANIDLRDRLGGALNGNNTYTRFNPLVGATYKLTPEITAYAGYSEANRAPTPLELGCADPNNPCTIANFLVADPPLKQVVSRTVEGGFRGAHDFGDYGLLRWKVDGFRIANSDDILNVPSPVQGFGYFRNVGDTLRQGFELEANLRTERWYAYANYAYVDATFQSAVLLSSPNNPNADPGGTIQVRPGNHIPLVPFNRFKVGADYRISPFWTAGGDILFTGRQNYVGDEANLNPKLPSYLTFNLHSSYQVTKNIEVFGRIDNLLDKHYANFGTYFETDAISSVTFTDPRSVTPGAPRAFYGGVRATF